MIKLIISLSKDNLELNLLIDNHLPLIEAVKTGNSKIVDMILDAGADPNIPYDEFPLNIACREGHIDIVKNTT